VISSGGLKQSYLESKSIKTSEIPGKFTAALKHLLHWARLVYSHAFFLSKLGFYLMQKFFLPSILF